MKAAKVLHELIGPCYAGRKRHCLEMLGEVVTKESKIERILVPAINKALDGDGVIRLTSGELQELAELLEA